MTVQVCGLPSVELVRLDKGYSSYELRTGKRIHLKMPWARTLEPCIFTLAIIGMAKRGVMQLDQSALFRSALEVPGTFAHKGYHAHELPRGQGKLDMTISVSYASGAAGVGGTVATGSNPGMPLEVGWVAEGARDTRDIETMTRSGLAPEDPLKPRQRRAAELRERRAVPQVTMDRHRLEQDLITRRRLEGEIRQLEERATLLKEGLASLSTPAS